MDKFTFQLIAFLMAHASCFGFEKLAPKYTPSFGNPSAPIQIIEYFSLSCDKCLAFLNRDFATFKREAIDTGKVYWVFHPDPADLPTLYAICCFEKLLAEEKGPFLFTLAKKIARNQKSALLWMQLQMKHLGREVEELSSLALLEKSQTAKAAFAYLKQSDVPREIPSIEINGILRKEFPSLAFLRAVTARRSL